MSEPNLPLLGQGFHSQIDVFNQRGEQVLTYTARRMLAGRAAEGGR